MYQTYQASGKELGSPPIRSKLDQMQRRQDWGISYAQRRRGGHLKHVVLKALIKKVERQKTISPGLQRALEKDSTLWGN